jgi:hypothetical protein
MRADELRPPVQMTQLLVGFQLSQALYAAAVLGVADHLVAGPAPVAVLAEHIRAHASSLHRLLRTLAVRELQSDRTSSGTLCRGWLYLPEGVTRPGARDHRVGRAGGAGIAGAGVGIEISPAGGLLDRDQAAAARVVRVKLPASGAGGELVGD